jgi:hypothetical protein
MKTHFKHSKPRRRESGMATMLFVVLMGLMMVLVASNVRTIRNLHLTEKLIEQKQIQRLNASQTNAVAVALPESK